ncbi:MAG: hypothetical protein NVS4B6_31110 [Mycobacterium sp.]
MSAMKVWAVTSGSYSDYRVDLLFTTKELAEAYIASKQEGSRWSEPNDTPECFAIWDALPGPDELRWYASAVLLNFQVLGRNEWSDEVHPWDADFEDSETISEYNGTTRIVVARHTKEEAVQRVSEWVAEQMDAERKRLGL